MSVSESSPPPQPTAAPMGRPVVVGPEFRMPGEIDPLDRIESHLESVVATMNAPAILRDAIAYALLGGGKRLRPLAAWHAASAAADDPGAGPSSLPAGAAVELIHAFSLAHDDLPAMDDDDMRRGRPTLHIHAGEAMAVLAGDAMLNAAFDALLADPSSRPHAYALVRELHAGTAGMIVGQVYDTLGGFEGGLSDHERLVLVHSNKTGALLRASIRLGAMFGLISQGADLAGPRLDGLSRYADAIGLSYQIVDDLLDVEQTSEHLGKRAGKDQDAGKLTYPGVLGVEASRDHVERLRVEAHRSLDDLGRSADPLRELADRLARRTK